MSILAQITVVECDGCKKLTTLSNEVERESFDKTWLRTPDKDFCFLCRETLEQADEKVVAAVMGKMLKKYGAAEVLNG